MTEEVGLHVDLHETPRLADADVPLRDRRSWARAVNNTPETRGLRVPKRAGVRVELVLACDLPVPFWSRANRSLACSIALNSAPGRIEQAELHMVNRRRCS